MALHDSAGHDGRPGDAAPGDDRPAGAADLAVGDRAAVVSQTSLYETTFGGPCGGADKVDEVPAGVEVQVTAACEDGNGDRWVEVAARPDGTLGWVDAADLDYC